VQLPPAAVSGFSLDQNYPNPFNPTTEIRFQVTGVSDVKLVVYDLLGREVAVLMDGMKAPGVYTVKFSATGGSTSGGNASSLSSGVYLYRLKAGDFVQTRKMILTR
jgi:hypothetical protein